MFPQKRLTNRQEVAVVSGASGFVGTHLVRALIEQGIMVVPIPRTHFYSEALLTGLMKLNQPDYIYHLAANGNMAYDKDDSLIQNGIFNANLFGTFNMLKASRHIPYKAFINVSSSSVNLEHQTLYSATKGGAEYLCDAFAAEFDKPIVSVRPYSLYGSEEAPHRFIPTVFRSCLTGSPMTLSPDPVHDWVYIDDFITALLDLQTGWDSEFAAIEVSTGIGTTNREVVKLITDITGKQPNITDLRSLRSFDTKAWIGEKPEGEFTPLEKGLQLYYDWYKAQRKGVN